MDNQKNESGQDTRDYQEDRISHLEQKFQRLDSVNQTLTNQIVDTLHTLNENIVNLGDYLTTTGLGGETVQKTKLDIGREEDLKEPSDQVNQVDQMDTLNKNKEGMVCQKDNDAAKIL